MNRLLLACVVLAAANAAVEAECVFGYTQREGGNCYKLFGQNRHNWLTADHICTSEGGWLTTLRNEADSVWVNSFFHENRRHFCTDWYWIGANDFVREGVYEWVQDGSVLQYFNWLPGEPNHHIGYNEDVVEVNSANRQWNDNILDGVQLCFICEKKPIGSC
ncbi:perlucin-like protein [Patiria miniata]|uniref:C-type lectin domain-containing protein n=1 Tax=Patiria miniata TaxID=46514 RepID=A0A913Z5F6_PATMI|nr:perlucin-like protein [Patiria miniata]